MKPVLELSLSPFTAEVSRARHSLGTLDERFPREVLERLRLLVTELVTNAVRHAGLGAGDLIRLRVFDPGNGVRVEVEDPGHGFTVTVGPAPSPTESSGWGLYLVAKLADRWGAENRAGAREADESSDEGSGRSDTNLVNLVWFELDDIDEARP